jgi:hypothetical protein
VVVLYRGAHGSGGLSHIDPYQRKTCAVAYRWAEVKFSLVLGGSHAVSYNAALKLITAMNITIGQTVWDIGCGVPALAAAISAVTACVVLCTDLGTTFKIIKDVCKEEMRHRVMKRNEEACMVDLLALNDLEGYVDSLTPYTEGVPNLASLIVALNAQMPSERPEIVKLKIDDFYLGSEGGTAHGPIAPAGADDLGEEDDLVGEDDLVDGQISSSEESDASGSVHNRTRLQRKIQKTKVSPVRPASQRSGNGKQQRMNAPAPPASDGSSSGSENSGKIGEEDEYSDPGEDSSGNDTESSASADVFDE